MQALSHFTHSQAPFSSICYEEITKLVFSNNTFTQACNSPLDPGVGKAGGIPIGGIPPGGG